MGKLNVTNAIGQNVNISSLQVNGTELGSGSISPGETRSNEYNNKTGSQFDRMILKINCNSTSYKVDLNRDHYFGDNDGAYPGSDYDIDLILMGFDGSNIKLMQTYGKSGSFLNYCNDTKSLQPE
jgi:hypothetical protein